MAVALLACKAAEAPARSSSQANKGKAPATKAVYNYAEEYPDLRYLAPQLAHFAHE